MSSIPSSMANSFPPSSDNPDSATSVNPSVSTVSPNSDSPPNEGGISTSPFPIPNEMTDAILSLLDWRAQTVMSRVNRFCRQELGGKTYVFPGGRVPRDQFLNNAETGFTTRPESTQITGRKPTTLVFYVTRPSGGHARAMDPEFLRDVEHVIFDPKFLSSEDKTAWSLEARGMFSQLRKFRVDVLWEGTEGPSDQRLDDLWTFHSFVPNDKAMFDMSIHTHVPTPWRDFSTAAMMDPALGSTEYHFHLRNAPVFLEVIEGEYGGFIANAEDSIKKVEDLLVRVRDAFRGALEIHGFERGTLSYFLQHQQELLQRGRRVATETGAANSEGSDSDSTSTSESSGNSKPLKSIIRYPTGTSANSILLHDGSQDPVRYTFKSGLVAIEDGDSIW